MNKEAFGKFTEEFIKASFRMSILLEREYGEKEEYRFEKWVMYHISPDLRMWRFGNLYVIHDFNDLRVMVSDSPEVMRRKLRQCRNPHLFGTRFEGSVHIPIHLKDNGDWWRDIALLSDSMKEAQKLHDKKTREETEEADRLRLEEITHFYQKGLANN